MKNTKTALLDKHTNTVKRVQQKRSGVFTKPTSTRKTTMYLSNQEKKKVMRVAITPPCPEESGVHYMD